MKTRTRTLFAALLSALMILGALQTAAPAAAFAADGAVETLIVEIEDAPAAPGAARAVRSRLLARQQSVKARIRKGFAADIRGGYRFTQLLNGFTVRASVKDADAIRAMEGVKNVYVSKSRPAPKAENASVLPTDGSLAITGVREMHEAGYKGEGQVIAVIDSGFDLAHPFLTTPPDDGTALRFRTAADVQAKMDAGDMNADVSAAESWHNTKAVFVWNYGGGSSDTLAGNTGNTHGSHVAGIAGGKNGTLPDGGAFNGMAPEAQLILMSNLDETGAAPDHLSLAALEDAVTLGADVINMSWGSDYAEYDVFNAVFANARRAGIFLTVAAGNSNRAFLLPENTDYGSMGTPGYGPYEFNVGSAATPGFYDGREIRITVDGAPEEPFVTDLYTDDMTFPVFDAAQAAEFVYFDGAEVNTKGKIAVLPTDVTEAAVEKAIKDGATGLLYLIPDTQESDLTIMISVLALAGEAGLPVQWIDSEWGASHLKTNGTLSIEILCKEGDAPVVMSAFSSWGVGRDLEPDPDVTAPGEQIYSSVPEMYNYQRGTSMAAPCMAGAAALIRQYLLQNAASFAKKSPEKQVEEIQERVQSAADILFQPIRNEGIRENSMPYSPRVQGAGLLQVMNAAQTPVYLRGKAGEAKIGLGEIDGPFTVSFTAVNDSARAVTFDSVGLYLFTTQFVPDEAMLETGSYEPGREIFLHRYEDVADFMHTVSVKLPCKTGDMPARVTVPARGETEIRFTVTPDAKELKELQKTYVNGFFVDGFVVLSQPRGAAPALSIPFTGFYGDWSAAPVLDRGYWTEGRPQSSTLLRLEQGISGLELDPVADPPWYPALLGASPLGVNPAKPHPDDEPGAYGPDDFPPPDDFPEGDLPEDGAEEPSDEDPAFDPDDPGFAPDEPAEEPLFVGYDEEAVYDDPAFAGVSPNGDGVNDYLTAQLYPLRNADWSRLTVLDEAGKTPAALASEPLCWIMPGDDEEKTAYGESAALDKLCPNVFVLSRDFDGQLEDLTDEIDAGAYAPDLPEGDYVLRAEARFTGNAERTETLEFPFYVDLTAPGSAGAFLREEDRLYLEVTSWDDRHLAAVGIWDANAEKCLLLHPVAGAEEETFVFDVTELEPGAWEVRAFDYAGNVTAVPVSPYHLVDMQSITDTWSRKIGEPARYLFETFAPGEEPTGALVDGAALKAKDWRVENGCELVIEPAALSALKDGAHTLTVRFGDAEAETGFTVNAAPFTPGDVDLDGRVTAADARLALRVAVGLENVIEGAVYFRAADMSADGGVTAEDARLVLRRAVGLE